MERGAYKELAEVENLHWWFSARRSIVSALLSGYYAGGGAEILDVGSGTGGNLVMLSAFGKVSALEMDAEAAAYSRGVFPAAAVRVGALPESAADYAEGSFDLVTMLDVLEHIGPDQAAVRSAEKLLKPGGLLFITVPAFQCLFGPHDQEMHHFRRYSRAELAALAAASGLKLERLAFFSCFLFPLLAVSRALDILLKRKKAAGMRLPAHPINRFFYRVFLLERPLLKFMSMPFGSSLLLVLRKARN
jgi:2-polyprenyl-3-methyl-5-hydroxy-6-metoxy-1,4-benzoquinol methylase